MSDDGDKEMICLKHIHPHKILTLIAFFRLSASWRKMSNSFIVQWISRSHFQPLIHTLCSLSH